ncbi:cell surface protein [Methanosarcina horonobensis HB-1 = JCM 15518]|uniref:Cell surface protein n=1 Tax=Methanosarcina horonobensis HB-1 = JCM 15518 TaxID=1434110 RepID=A0A0E3S7Z6_9EURY|nr:PKD domain-containing protein [Methanosarcina horonobensis]AKB77554.1 cell surface protein [Methanosarcina horonobensis HB-1 = JCM 15518]
MRNKFFSVALALLFLVFVSAIASAGQEILVTSYGEKGFNPAIYDDKIVWTYNAYGDVVYMRNLSTGKEIQITDQSGSPPSIYGDRVVWEYTGSIYLYNTSSGIKTRLVAADSVNEGKIEYLSIYGDKVVWEDNRDQNYSSENWNIYVYDLSTSRETRVTSTPITTRTFATEEVAIYGDRIVWLGDRIDNGTTLDDIYMYNLSTSVETRVTTSGLASSPKIYGDRIVYMDWRSGNSSIYLYNISTSVETQVTKSESDHSISAFYGDRIVWEDYRNGNWDIYMYDLSTSTETQITTDISDQRKPAIYGNRIVWQDYRNTDLNNYYCEIYMYDFSDKPVMPFASFTTNVTSGYGNVPLTVLFTDTSTGGEPTSWYWDFGDGTNSKHAQTATHTFTKTGTYEVILTATNSAGSTTVKKSNCTTVTSPQAPVADFFSPEVESIYGESISTNETVSFTDNSTGSPTSWLWDFGDGVTSTARNPAHTYNAMGGYTVNLTVTNSIGIDTTGKYGYVLVGITDTSASPAHFSSNITNGSAPLTVIFHDDDAGIIDPIWRDWDFGDGVTQSYGVDNNASATPYATHVYEKPGKYTVTLYMDNRGGLSIMTKHNYITVTDPNMPLADFSANITSGPAPLVVLFTDTSTGPAPTSWLWDFGDGIDSKRTMNATHTFTNPGVYDVTLTVTNREGNNTMKKSSYITVTN